MKIPSHDYSGLQADSAANDVTNHLHFAELQSRVAELTRQLDVASTSRHGVQEEMQREILDLQSINSALKESCTTSEEREKMLQVLWVPVLQANAIPTHFLSLCCPFLQDKLSQMEAESRKSMEQGAAAFLVAQDSEHLQAQITTLGEQCQRQADEMVEAVAIILQLETDAQHSMEGLRAQEVRVEGMQQELAFLEASVAAKTALVLSLEEQSAAMAAEKSRFLARMEELQAEADRAGLQLHAPEAAERLVVVEAELEARVKEVEELKRQLSLVPVSAQEETNPEAVTGSGARGLQERVEELQAQLEAAEEEKSFEVAAKEALLARLRELEEQQEAALQQRLDAQVLGRKANPC